MYEKILSFLFNNKTDDQTVAKNTVWLSISNFGGRLIKAVIIIYAARVLDPAGWGIFSYAVTLAGFLTFFVDPGVNILLIREGSKGEEEHKMQLLSTTFYIKLVLIALAALFVLFVGPFFSTLPGATTLLPIVALIIVGDTLREFFSSFIRSREKMEKEAGIFLVTNISIVVIGFIALAVHPSALSFGWAYAAGTTIGAVLAFWVLRDYISRLFSRFNAALIAPIIRSAWPFAITATLGILLTNADILIISWLRTASDVGIYSAAVRIIQVLYLFPVIIQYSTLPLLSRLAVKNPERFRTILERTVATLFVVSVPLTLGGAILSTQIMTSVFGPAYAAGGLSLVLLMLSVIVDYPGGVIGLAIFAYDKQRTLITASVIGGVTNVLFDLVLIPHYGIAGSAMATLIAQIANNVYLWYAMKKINYFEVLPRLKRIFAAGFIMAIATGLMLFLGTNFLVNIVVSSIVYVLLLKLFHEPLLGAIAKIMKKPQDPGGATIMLSDPLARLQNPLADPLLQNAELILASIPKGVVRIGETSVAVEVAKDTAAIRKGLAGRDSLAPEHGMLFVFAKPKSYRFWMRDMRFPLDIIWLRDGKVVGISENVQNKFDPNKPTFTSSPEKTDCVLEVNAGFAKRNNIVVGDSVHFEGVRPEFQISKVEDTPANKEIWNRFVNKNHPIVGAFLETWEWGMFQKNLDQKMERYFITEKKTGKDTLAAVFTLIRYPLPLGLMYAYMPRGPIMAKEHIDSEIKHFEILQAVQKWAKVALADCVFLRTEPSLYALSGDNAMYGFRTPSYNVQPPHNTVVPLSRSEEEILARFHSSTRSNIKRAERRGVTFEMRTGTMDVECKNFFGMIESTIKRNHGKNAYPNEHYIRTFLSSNRILSATDVYDPVGMSLAVFCGYQNNKPAATHIVVFCGDTATYLFGASNTECLSSKVDTYLHWNAMKEAKRRGMKHYDLGGIDERIWPSLTTFKRQFGGDEFTYVGNIDVPLRPILYHSYNIFKKTVKKMRDQA